MRSVRTAQLVLAMAAVGLVISGAVLLGLAAHTSGADCTFDNYTCKANHLLGDALRCFAAAVLLGASAVLARWIRKRREKAHPTRPAG